LQLPHAVDFYEERLSFMFVLFSMYCGVTDFWALKFKGSTDRQHKRVFVPNKY